MVASVTQLQAITNEYVRLKPRAVTNNAHTQRVILFALFGGVKAKGFKDVPFDTSKHYPKPGDVKSIPGGYKIKKLIQTTEYAGKDHGPNMPITYENKQRIREVLYDWGFVVASDAIDLMTSIANEGGGKDIALIKEIQHKVDSVTREAWCRVADRIADRSSNKTTGSMAFLGIKDLCDSTATVDFGDTDANDFAVWAGQKDTASYVISPSDLKAIRRNAQVAASRKGRPDWYFMDQEKFDALTDIFDAQKTADVVRDTVVYQMGWSGVEWEGAQITVDENLGELEVFGLNSNFLELHLRKGWDPKPLVWMNSKEYPDDPGCHTTIAGQLVTDLRKAHVWASDVANS